MLNWRSRLRAEYPMPRRDDPPEASPLNSATADGQSPDDDTAQPSKDECPACGGTAFTDDHTEKTVDTSEQ